MCLAVASLQRPCLTAFELMLGPRFLLQRKGIIGKFGFSLFDQHHYPAESALSRHAGA